MTLARLQGELDTVQGQYAVTVDDAEESVVDEGDLRAARQTLTAEMLALQPYYNRPDNDAVAGIPVDSEYIIFVIDTSGSMQQYNWGRVQAKLTERSVGGVRQCPIGRRKTVPTCTRPTVSSNS